MPGFAGLLHIPCPLLKPRSAAVQAKLNTDDVPTIATDYGIRSIPTIIVFKDGKRVDTIIGAVPKENLVDTINKYM